MCSAAPRADLGLGVWPPRVGVAKNRPSLSLSSALLLFLSLESRMLNPPPWIRDGGGYRESGTDLVAACIFGRDLWIGFFFFYFPSSGNGRGS